VQVLFGGVKESLWEKNGVHVESCKLGRRAAVELLTWSKNISGKEEGPEKRGFFSKMKWVGLVLLGGIVKGEGFMRRLLSQEGGLGGLESQTWLGFPSFVSFLDNW